MGNPLFDKIRYCREFVKQSIFRYNFIPEKYAATFLANSCTAPKQICSNIPRIIYVFWTGTNEMSANRKACFQSIVSTVGVDVKLITPTNLEEYILADYPLHPAFNSLSLVHKSDYLRCYFMHHYGGGYSDVKTAVNSWHAAFDLLEKSDKWMLGYPEISAKAVANVPGVIGQDMRKHFLSIIGNCAYIFRPQNSFTSEWYNELHKRMDGYQADLIKFPGNTMGDNKGYPIPWTNILGDIFHPLCLKYRHKIYKSDRIKPNFKNYR